MYLPTLTKLTCNVNANKAFRLRQPNFIACVRMMIYTRNRNVLPETIRLGLAAIAPGVAESLQKNIDTLPGSSTLCRSQCTVDIALMLRHQRLLSQHAHCLYLLADSSPQCQYNFFMCSSLAIRTDCIANLGVGQRNVYVGGAHCRGSNSRGCCRTYIVT
jgi:hypothetical protein